MVEPKFEVSENWLTVSFARKSPQAEIAGTQVTGEATGEVTREVAKLLLACEEERTRRDMQARLGLKGEENFRNLYLTPAIEAGLVEMTVPDKPRSSRQRYRLTGKGRETLEKLRRNQ